MIRILLCFVALFGYASAQAATQRAQAQLESRSDSKASGLVTFSQTSQGLKIEYDLKGLKKNGVHGFHVHEKGDCSSPDAKSAGGHYAEVAPTGGTSKDTPEKFAGDLPEIRADKDGNSKGEVLVKTLTLDQTHPILNRAIMIHGGPDNLKRKSAPRIACGVIQPM